MHRVFQFEITAALKLGLSFWNTLYFQYQGAQKYLLAET